MCCCVLQALDPRLFQSACFPACGCSFPDEALDDEERIAKFGPGYKPINASGFCGPDAWSQWILRHFPCSGVTDGKAVLMRALLDGFYSRTPAQIAGRKAG